MACGRVETIFEDEYRLARRFDPDSRLDSQPTLEIAQIGTDFQG
jgi:hypothetical protein